MLKEHSHTFSRLALLSEIFAIIISWIIAIILSQTILTYRETSEIIFRFDISLIQLNWPTISLIIIVWALVLHASKLYSLSKRNQHIVKLCFTVIKIHSMAFIVFFIAAYFLKLFDIASRKTFVIFYLLSLATMIFLTFFINFPLRVIRKKGFNFKRVVIVGAGNLGKEILKQMMSDKWLGYQVCGFLDDAKAMNDCNVIGRTDDLAEIISREKIDTVIVTLSFSHYQKIERIIKEAQDRLTDLYLVPDLFHFKMLNYAISDLNGIPMLNIISAPRLTLQAILKRLIDIGSSSLLIILFSPFFILLSIMIKIESKGPVLFRQKRMGIDGRIFTIYKFRSMYFNKDKHLADSKQATKDDFRITRVGKFLRYSSLDELPQFFNVLIGNMSLVGPRPHTVTHNNIYKDLIPSYLWRHKVKPGITGWAQANGWRGETEALLKMEKRVEFDKYYMENWSIFFDIKIMLLTIRNLFKNAY